jgi:hypothetical protein
MTSIDIEAALSEEEHSIHETVHKFAEEVMRPAGTALDALADPQDVIAKDSILWGVFEKHDQLGLEAIADPESGFTPVQQARLRSIIGEEMGWGDSGLAISFGVNGFPRNLALLSGNPELLERYARPGLIGCWAITEPDHGSDQIRFATDPKVEHLGRPNCIATQDGDSYVIQGQKAAWVSNGTIADAAALFCAVDRGEGVGGVGGFLVPLDDPAVSRGKPLDKIGQRALNQGEIFFDGLRVPAAARPSSLGPGPVLREGAHPGRRADLRAPEREGAALRDVPQGRGRARPQPSGRGVQRHEPPQAPVRHRLEGHIHQHGFRGGQCGSADLRRQRSEPGVSRREAAARCAGLDDRGWLQRHAGSGGRSPPVSAAARRPGL